MGPPVQLVTLLTFSQVTSPPAQCASCHHPMDTLCLAPSTPAAPGSTAAMQSDDVCDDEALRPPRRSSHTQSSPSQPRPLALPASVSPSRPTPFPPFPGFLADSLIARGVSVTTVRKAMQTASMLPPAAALLLLATPGITPAAAVACMTAALGVTSLGQAGFVANMSDIAPNNAGQMFGLCNTFGSAAGILGVVAVGVIVQATGSFAPVFQITAGLYVLAVVVWNLMCTGERVF